MLKNIDPIILLLSLLLLIILILIIFCEKSEEEENEIVSFIRKNKKEKELGEFYGPPFKGLNSFLPYAIAYEVVSNILSIYSVSQNPENYNSEKDIIYKFVIIPSFVTGPYNYTDFLTSIKFNISNNAKDFYLGVTEKDETLLQSNLGNFTGLNNKGEIFHKGEQINFLNKRSIFLRGEIEIVVKGNTLEFFRDGVSVSKMSKYILDPLKEYLFVFMLDRDVSIEENPILVSFNSYN